MDRIYDNLSDIILDEVFFKLDGFLKNNSIHVKLENFNVAGSIKLKTAISLVESFEGSGQLNKSSKLIESSSGNLGVALSLLCAIKGYPFICVTDPNVSEHNLALMKAYGTEVIVVNSTDKNGGYLGQRIDLIHKMTADDPSLIWLNQYANPANPLAHYKTTAPAISKQFPALDYLFIGAGTTGTLVGCAQYFKEHSPKTQIIAVDSVGSVTFGHPPQKRCIPGLGTSRRPSIFDESLVDDVVMVPETVTLNTCSELLRTRGWLIGGSTSTVLAGIRKYEGKIEPGASIATISPDFGVNYIKTIYNERWRAEKFGLQSQKELDHELD